MMLPGVSYTTNFSLCFPLFMVRSLSLSPSSPSPSPPPPLPPDSLLPFLLSSSCLLLFFKKIGTHYINLVDLEFIT